MNGLDRLRLAHPFPPSPPEVPASEHGWFGPEHVELLSPCVGPKTQVILELGSWMGKSTRWLANQAPQATVIAVDHWQGSPEHVNDENYRKLIPTLYDTFIKGCWPLKDRIIALKMDTVQGMWTVLGHEVMPDVIYLDASHEYEDVRRDLEILFNLFPKALLAGDDLLWPGVERAVREKMRERRLKIGRKHNVWWRDAEPFRCIPGGVPFE